jgi:transcriptional regulator GlxA family with amidase domain
MNAKHVLERVGIDLEAQRPRVAEALAFIAEHFREPITADQIAEAGGYSQRGMQDAFRRDLGRTSTDLMIELRLRAARDALTDALETRTVKEIAMSSGAQHAGRFSTRYRTLFGETPTQTHAKRR